MSNAKNIRDDEMWCPECGAPIKKGFFTCANCKLKVELTKDINKKQSKKKSKSVEPKGSPAKKTREISGKIKNKTEIPEPIVTDKEKKEVLDDIFEEDTPEKDSKKRGERPGWWTYS